MAPLDDRQRFATLRAGLLTGEDKPNKNLFSNAASKRTGDLQGPLEALIEAVAEAAARLVALEEFRRSDSLNRFGRLFCAAYRDEKLRAGCWISTT